MIAKKIKKGISRTNTNTSGIDITAGASTPPMDMYPADCLEKRNRLFQVIIFTSQYPAENLLLASRRLRR